MHNENKIIDSEEVENYYFYHLDDLADGKRLHWLIRHHLWFGDSLSKDLLHDFEGNFYKTTELGTLRFYKSLLKDDHRTFIQEQDKIRAEKRQEYSELGKMNRVLFKTLFSYTIFKKDTRPILKKIVDVEQVVLLRDKLWNNEEDIAILSTPAINFLSISAWAYGLEKPDAKKLLHIVNTYQNKKNAFSVSRASYLMTHAIIGESLFYSKRIERDVRTYKHMIRLIDDFFQKSYKHVKLDIKLEALLCSRMLGVKMQTQAKIIDEASKSKDKDGFFIVDALNLQKGKTPHVPSKSEHRNILYIMATHKPPKHLRSTWF
jgi:hypothetical protein